MNNAFDEYMNNAGLNEKYRHIAESAWNAALTRVKKLVIDSYDEQEPWMEPSDIDKFFSKPRD